MSKFEAVKESRATKLEDVKVVEKPDLTEDQIALIEKHGGIVEEKMHRLSVIDKAIAEIDETIAHWQALRAEKVELRGKVEEIAKTVPLLVETKSEEEGE